MRPFKQQDIGKPPKSSKNDMRAGSGIEGTISQGVRAFDLRVSRYLGIEKTHLQHVLTATAMNVARLFQWQMEDTPFQPRVSRFAALAA
jgi:transposase